MPSSPKRQAWRKIASPSGPSMCSLKRRPGWAAHVGPGAATAEDPLRPPPGDRTPAGRPPAGPRPIASGGTREGRSRNGPPPRRRSALPPGAGAGRGDRRENRGPVPAVAGPEANPIAVLRRDQADAVVLQLVDPFRSGWDLRRGPEQRWRDEAFGTATVPGERQTHQHEAQTSA